MKEPRDPADAWYECDCGGRHWGLYGAAGLLAHRDGEVLMQLRTERSHHGGTWGFPGGARKTGESASAAAFREANEEVGLERGELTPQWWRIVDHGGWSYTTVCAAASADAAPHARNWETDDVVWTPDPTALPLHPGVAAAWPAMKPLVGATLTLIVDNANVVGSTPNGWWKDRAGAARNLRDELASLARTGIAAALIDHTDLAGWWPRIIQVVEGQARGIGGTEGVTVVDAPGEGDDEIVAQARLAAEARTNPNSLIAVVTADRGLSARVRELGAVVMGPGTLRRAL
jgi:8-oxo-dGTP pyrophosphatase MutT (NUDIX family)